MIRRLSGLAVITGVLLLYVPDSGRVIDRVVLPAIAVAGAWLAVGRASVIALAVALLAGIHSTPGSDDWVTGLFYPLSAVAGSIVFLVELTKKLRDHARETRQVRWENRHSADGARAPRKGAQTR